MATIGKIEPYNRDEEDWSQYVERLDFYFQANKIEDDGQKRTAFLTLIGPKTFKILRSVVAPTKPGAKTYEELVAALTTQFQPKRSQVLYCSKFNQCVRKQGDSVATYLAELRALADDCAFGESLEVMLRDRLICGINDPVMQRRLLGEGDSLTLEKAMSVAQGIELAANDSQDLPSSTAAQEVKKVTSI